MSAVKRSLSWALVLVLVCAVSRAAQPPDNDLDLLARATKVSGVQAGQDRHPYTWISEHELLLFHLLPDRTWSLSRYDLTTHTERPLPTLSALFRQTGGLLWPPPVVSPDGRHLLWTGRHYWDKRSKVLCSDLAGSTFPHLNQPASGALSWLDDKHWELLNVDYVDMEAVHLLGIETGDIRPPYAKRKRRFSPRLFLCRSEIGGNSQNLQGLTLRSRHHLLDALIINRDYIPLKIRFNEYTLHSRSVTERSSFLPLTQQPYPGGEFLGAAQWPRDGRFAVAFSHHSTAPLWRPHLRPPKMKGEQSGLVSLWVASPTTGRVYTVGYVPLTDMTYGGEQFSDIRWVPGGKRLSFVYLDELYTVPAD